MPTQIGPAPSSVDLVDILLACHDRIRRFSDAAVRLAAPDLAEAEIREAAARIRYYFRASFPFHLDDEEDTLLPRLQGLSAEIDAALEAMEREHEEHRPLLAHVLAMCDTLVEEPSRHGALAAGLLCDATALRESFARHLAHEESAILPVIRTRLAPEVQAELTYEARARRGDG